MHQIRHKRIECIGCTVCAEIAPDYWFMDEDGMASLISKTKNVKYFEYAEGFGEDLEVLRKAEEACPVTIIKIL